MRCHWDVLLGCDRRSDRIAACLEDLEHEYVTAVDDDTPRFLPAVPDRARVKLNRIAAKMTRLPKQKARPVAQLREEWKESAIRTSGLAPRSSTPSSSTPVPRRLSGPGLPPWSMSPWRPSMSLRRCS
ncbi:hypothetical protein ACU639_00065 [Streptomyces cynarae]|uniref:hypothetical protein n=1 Tax=Streptomyces cynarae TaxID=2981134 RepID=UPI00406C9D4E